MSAVEMVADDYEPQEEVVAPDSAMTLLALMSSPNIAAELSDDELNKIGALVCDEYKIDHASCDEWREANEAAMKLATLVAEQKDYPFERAANVKYPLLTTAALQFNARAYAAIVPGDRVVKCKTFGRDPQGTKAARADRVSEYSSYQLIKEIPEWEEDTDRLTVILPITGCVFRKTYYDPALGRKCSRLIMPDRLVVNYMARSLEDTPRITEEVLLYPYEIEERIRAGRFVEFDYKATEDSDDADAPQMFLEQHRLYDLDGDGYPEPYICTVHKDTQKTVRIVAAWAEDTVTMTPDGRVSAIRRQDYYTKYLFLPSPDGGFYGMGFGRLLGQIGEAINTSINSMLDAGHLSNIQGGLISATMGLREKTIRLKMGEFKVVNTNQPLNQAVLPIKFDGPSTVMFQLLGLLIESGKEIASIKDVLTGEQKTNTTATTTLALIEQGLQVFTAIYKRMHRALGRELSIHARLNRQYLDPGRYNAFFDGPEQYNPAQDFAEDDMDIMPVTDPGAVSKMQKLAKAQFVHETGKENPMVNQEVALRRMYEAADIEDVDELIVPPPQPDPAEVAFMEAVKDLGLQEQMAKITELYTKSLKNVADAEAAEEGQQLSLYDMFLRALNDEHRMEMDLNGQGGVPGMASPAGDGMVLPAGGGNSQAGSAEPSGPVVQPGGLSAAGLGGPAATRGVPEGAL